MASEPEPEPEPTPESVITFRKNNTGIKPDSLTFERVVGPYKINQNSALNIFPREQIQTTPQEPDNGLKLPRRNKQTTKPSGTQPIDIPLRSRAKLKYKKSKRKKPSKKRKNKHKKKQTKKRR
jgi:hypothetical protein